MQLVDIVELAQLADEIDAGNIQNAVIGPKMTIDYIVPDTRAQVLLPLREKIRVVVDEMFAESEPIVEPAQAQAQAEVEAVQTAQAQARAEQIEQQAQLQQEIKEFLAQEDARLVVQNGTNIPNLASQTALFLKQQGFNIIQFGPADTNTYSHTVIVVYDESKTYTLQVLATLFEVGEENIRRSPNLKSDLDFRVIIGSDFEPPTSSSPSLLTTEE